MLLVKNGMDYELMKYHRMNTPKNNVYYSANILFPEAIFVAFSVPHMYECSRIYYGSKNKIKDKEEDRWLHPLYQYHQDIAILDVLRSVILQALAMAIGEEETEKLLLVRNKTYEKYEYYVTHYLDKCNLELIKTPVEKRKDKIRNITRRIIKKPEAYLKMENVYKLSAKKYNTSIYNYS